MGSAATLGLAVIAATQLSAPARPTSTPAVTATVAPTATAAAVAIASPPPTPTATPTPSPTATPTASPTPTPAPAPVAVPVVVTTPPPTPAPVLTSTVTPSRGRGGTTFHLVFVGLTPRAAYNAQLLPPQGPQPAPRTGSVAPDGTVIIDHTAQLGDPPGLYQYTIVAGAAVRILSFEIVP